MAAGGGVKQCAHKNFWWVARPYKSYFLKALILENVLGTYLVAIGTLEQILQVPEVESITKKPIFSPIFGQFFTHSDQTFWENRKQVTPADVDSFLRFGWPRFDVRSKSFMLENILKTYNDPVRPLENFFRWLKSNSYQKSVKIAVFWTIFHPICPNFLGKLETGHASGRRFISTHRMTKIRRAFESFHAGEHFKNL